MPVAAVRATTRVAPTIVRQAGVDVDELQVAPARARFRPLGRLQRQEAAHGGVVDPVARIRDPTALGTTPDAGRDKPVPYDPFPLRVRVRIQGRNKPC